MARGRIRNLPNVIVERLETRAKRKAHSLAPEKRVALERDD
jgi:plasmid stability protein